MKPLVPIPLPVAQHLVQASVDAALYREVQAVAKKNRMTMKQVVVWCFQEFLAHTDPEAAEKLGVKVEK